MKKISNALKWLKQKAEVYKNGLGIILFTCLVSIMTFMDLATNLVGKFRSSTLANQNVSKPIFKNKQSKDTVNILVVKFDDYFKTAPNNCVGNVLAHRIRYLKFKKKLPINVEYADSIDSPNEPADASKILKDNNAEILVYGLYKNNTTICDSGFFCFKTASYNLIKQVADYRETKLDNNEMKFRPFRTYALENGILSLDSISFDSWIQSLYVLKKRGELYNEYVTLYNINQHVSNKDKVQAYLKRSNLNTLINNYYDAIADIDTAISFLKIESDSIIKSSYISLKPGERFLKRMVIASRYHAKITRLNEEKYTYYLFFEPIVALKIVNQEISRIDRVLNNPFIDSTAPAKNVRKKIDGRIKNDKKTYTFEEVFAQLLGKKKLDGDGNYSITGRDELLNLYTLKALILILSGNGNSPLTEIEKYFKLSKGASTRYYYTLAILLYTKKGDTKNVTRYYNEALRSGLNKEALKELVNISKQLFLKPENTRDGHPFQLIIGITILILCVCYFLLPKFQMTVNFYLKKILQ